MNPSFGVRGRWPAPPTLGAPRGAWLRANRSSQLRRMRGGDGMDPSLRYVNAYDSRRQRNGRLLSQTASECQSGSSDSTTRREGASHEGYDDWIGHCKACLPGSPSRLGQRGSDAYPVAAWGSAAAFCAAAAVADRDGGVWRIAALGARIGQTRSRGESDRAAVRASVREDEQERCG